MQPQNIRSEMRESEVRMADVTRTQGSFRVLQAAWVRSGRVLRAALHAWQESCTALLAAVRRGDAKEVADREDACVDRQRDLDAAMAREAAARDRYLAALLHPDRELRDAS